MIHRLLLKKTLALKGDIIAEKFSIRWTKIWFKSLYIRLLFNVLLIYLMHNLETRQHFYIPFNMLELLNNPTSPITVLLFVNIHIHGKYSVSGVSGS